MEAVATAATASAGALQALLPKLADMLAGEYKLQKGAKEGIRYIREELESMQTALDKVSELPPDRLDEQAKLWARKVREMSYHIEDTIVSYMVAVNPAAGESGSSTTCCGSDIRGILPRTCKARRHIATEIERIKKEVEVVSKRREMYKVDGIEKAEPSDPRLPFLYQDAAKLVGIDRSREEIVELLSMGAEGASEEQMLRLVSIVGPGGMGKTTLANAVYQKLQEQFDRTAFISVSLKPNIKNILGSILRQVTSNIEDVPKAKDKSTQRQESQRNHGNAETWSEKDIIDKIRDVLEDKRYLIISDDIWDESAWKHLECVLVPNKLGSKVITTTRNADVAKSCCSSEQVDGTVHELRPLSDVESKQLFYYKVFGRDGCPPDELKDVSGKILEKCKGWPLAIVAIASLLANKSKQTRDQWHGVYNSIRTGLENKHGVKDMRLILSLSYCDMPSQLRSCFLYLSMFPEDHIIGRDDLIWRWMAEDFVRGEQDENLYELGDQYFNELISRNMIQPIHVDTVGRAQACRVHDMVLEFITFLSAEEGFVTILNGQPFPSEPDSIHRLSLRNSKEEQGVPRAVKRLPHVRTLVVSSRTANSMPSLSIFPVLRVLDLGQCTSRNIKGVENLVHLRYLRLSQAYYGGYCIVLPEGIGRLQFLQILDIKEARVEELPATVVQLRQLIVLELSLYSWDKRYEKRLIQCLCNLKKLESLYISARDVSLDFTLQVDWASPHLRRFTARAREQTEHTLRPGSVWTEFSSFSTLPRWINSSLSSLSDLSIMVRKLQQRDVEILAHLPILLTLDLEVVEATEGRLMITGHETSFRCLANLKFASRAMGLLFAPGAMQKLHRLYLSFDLAETKDVYFKRKDVHGHGDFYLGLENLTSLKTVDVEIDCRCAWLRELEAAEAALCNAANLNPNHPTLDVRRYFVREMLSEKELPEEVGARGEEDELAGLIRMGPWGGNGGRARDIRVAPRRLETVTIHSGSVVDSLTFSYSDHNGQHRSAGPWGGRGGRVSTIRLGPSEYLTEVSGRIGSCGLPNVITSLTLVTNAASYGPFGKGDGHDQFVARAQSNSSIVGFFGRAGGFVDAVGFYARPL